MRARLKRLVSPPSASRIHLRRWMAACAATVPPGALVLDAGAGDSPYRDLFAGARYESADFKGVEKGYATDITYECDLSDIPVDDGRFERVFCNQVLEHVPDPVAVLRELRRVVRPGGEVWVTSPLFYEEHEAPYDYYRYTQYAWRRFATEADLELRSIEWLEGYYATLAHQLWLAARSLPLAFLPLRLVFFALAHGFSRLDVRAPLRGRGMCKNYACVFVRPSDG